jgi:AraC-like DNA-binding protein
MTRRYRSKSIIPKVSFWNINEEQPFNAVLFESTAPPDMMQYKAHQKNHFVVSYTLKGTFRSYIDFKETIIHTGDVGLVNPNQIHFVRPVDKKVIKVIILAFNRTFFNRLNLGARVKAIANDAQENLTIRALHYDTDVIPLLMRSVFNEFKTTHKLTPTLISLMSLLVTRICEQNQSRKELPKDNFIYYSFLKLLDEQVATTHRVSNYADALHISEKSLNRACQAVAQHSTQAIIHQKINFEAKRQLMYDQSSAKEIAYSVGFADPVQFSKFFKQHNGLTPLEYRKKVRSGRLS